MQDLTVEEVLVLIGQHQIEIAKRDKEIVALRAQIAQLKETKDTDE